MVADPVHCFDVGQRNPRRVLRQGEGHVVVAERCRHDVSRFTIGQCDRGVGVAQAVERDVGNTDVLVVAAKPLSERVRPGRAPVGERDDKN